MVGIRVGVGKVAINSVPMCTSQDIVSVVSIDEAEWCKEYISMVLQYKAPVLAAQAQGATITGISSKTLKSITIPVAPLETQRRIVEELRAIEAQKVAANSILKSFSALVKSRFVEMFEKSASLKMVRLKDVCSVITDGTHQSPKFQSEGVPFLFVSNIANNELTYETSKYISLEDYETLIKRTPIEIGDILVSAVGSFGHPAIVKDERPFCFQRHIAYLKPRQEKVNSVFLHSALLSDGAQRYMDSAAKGVAQRTVTLNSFKELVIPLPPLSLQQEFAAFAAEVDKSRVVVQRQVVKYNDVIASSGIAIIGRGELV